MRRPTPIAAVATTVMLLAACQDGTPTSPKTSELPTPSASTTRLPNPFDCGDRCNQIAFQREGFEEFYGYPVIYSIKPDGTGLKQVLPYAEQPAWSPNHQKLAVVRRYSLVNGIGTVNADGTGLVMLTTNRDDQDPKFSPDGTKIVFARVASDGTFDIWMMNANGTQQTPITATPGYNEYTPDFSPDGKSLVFTTSKDGVWNTDIAVLDLVTMNKTVISASPNNELNPSWSPDGKRIAFQTGVSGPNVACIAMVNPNGGNRTEITSNGTACSQPTWSPDSKSVAFRSQANGLSLIVQAAIVNNVPVAYTAVTKTQYIDSQPAWAR